MAQKTPDPLESQDSPRASGFFAWRTASLPFDVLLDWCHGLRTSTCPSEPAPLGESLADDRRLLRERLQQLLDRSDVREALYIASPSLVERIDVWRRDPESVEGRDVESALVRYLQRMSGRATPFGLFAGCSVGGLNGATRLQLQDASRYRKRSRLDFDYLSALVEKLDALPESRATLRYRPNSSLYKTAGRFHYSEERLADSVRSYHLVAVDVTDYLEAALESASRGATLREVAEAITRVRPDVTIPEAEAYVGELIDTKMLISELPLPVTGPDPIDALIAETARHASMREAAERLVEARTILGEIDAAGPGASLDRYSSLVRVLESLPAKIDPSTLVQVDLIKPAAASLGPEVLSELVRGIDVLRRLTDPAPSEDLVRFRRAFSARYEGREIPLLEALDEETGIGLGASPDNAEGEPLLGTLALAASHDHDGGPRWHERDAHLLGKLMEACEAGKIEIVLDEQDLEKLSQREPPVPPGAFAVICAVATASPEALGRGEFRVFINGVTGPSGARLLGRFCHADEVLCESVADHLRAEEDRTPGAILAEVVHLPEGRSGNVLFRPVLREYEIPFLGRSGAAPDKQIPLSDLMVSVAGTRIVLRSRRLGREVIPRLTSAHNFARRSLPVYRFLGSLQMQGVGGWLAWPWGPLRDAPFLPRVRWGRVVLSKARWILGADELKALGNEDGAHRILRARRWRAERKLPRFVGFRDGDNELPLDLDNILSIDAFADTAKKRPSAMLTEMFPAPDELCAVGPEGRFVHELIVPFVTPAVSALAQDHDHGHGHAHAHDHDHGHAHAHHHDHAHDRTAGHPHEVEEPHHAQAHVRRGDTPMVARSFPPGSEWLYARIDTGAANADRVLTECLGPVVREALKSGAADRWFFIRYGDPDWHMRVRLHGSPARLAAEVLPALHAALEPGLGDGRVRRLQLDTYDREVERYGGPEGILVAEEAFQADSEAALAILGLLDGDSGSAARWRLCLWGIDRMLDDLGLDAAQKLSFATRRKESFAREFSLDKAKKIRLGDKFRKERADLEGLFRAGEDREGADHELAPGLAILRASSRALVDVAGRLRALAGSGRLTVSIDDVAVSLTHMRANRLLRSAHRAQEAVFYDFLERIYEGRAARQKASRPRAVPLSAPAKTIDVQEADVR